MRIILPALALVLALQLSCATGLNRYRARNVLKKMPEIKLDKKDIDIQDVSQMGQDNAVVDAWVRLAFKLTRTDDHGWMVDQIRLRDNQWESLDRLDRALRNIRWLETQERLLQFAQALLRYREDKGTFPPTSSTVDLTDILFPRYMFQLVRTDAWGTELRYTQLSDGCRYQVVSAGPDRKFSTPDDIVMVDTRILAAPPVSIGPAGTDSR